MSDLLIAPAYAEIAALKRHFQLLNGSPEMLEFLMSPGVTGSGLQTLLSSPVKLTQFQQFLASPVGAVSLAASSTAMNAVAASSIALNAVAASSTAMAAVAASSTAMSVMAASSTGMDAVAASSTLMAAVIASSTAMDAVLNSAVARKALYDSEIAWNAVVGSATARAALLAISTEHWANSSSHVYPPGSGAGVRAVLVQQKSNSHTSYAGARADTYITSSTNYVDRYARVTGLTHRSGDYRYSTLVKYVIMQ